MFTPIPQPNSTIRGSSREISAYIKSVNDLIRNINCKNKDTILIPNNRILQRFTTHSGKLPLLSNQGRYKLYISLKCVLLEAVEFTLRASGRSKNPENTNNEEYINSYVRKLNLLSWNIHGINSNTERRKSNKMEFLDIISSSDIICLQETKEEASIPNFMWYKKLNRIKIWRALQLLSNRS